MRERRQDSEGTFLTLLDSERLQDSDGTFLTLLGSKRERGQDSGGTF